jgi:autotransporter translocation and assembly factor TamB
MLGQPLSALGFDSVDIQPDLGSGGSVGVGKALSDRFYVEFKQGIGTDDTGAAARIDITDRIVLEGDVESEGNSSIKLKYKYDY